METLTANIVDSFVFRTNKLADSRGSGEAKLHIGPAADADRFNEFFGETDENGYFERRFTFERENLKRYLFEVEFEYRHQVIQLYKNVSGERWEELYDEADSLSPEELTYRLRPFNDGSRYYLHYTDQNTDWIFVKFLRRCALPLISEIVFRKQSDPDEPIVSHLRLSSDSENFFPLRGHRDRREDAEEEEWHPLVEEAIRRYEEELDEEAVTAYRERFEALRERFGELFGTEERIRENLTPGSLVTFLSDVDDRGRDEAGVFTLGMGISADPETRSGRALRDDFPALQDALVELLHGDGTLQERVEAVLDYSDRVRRFISGGLNIVSVLLCFQRPDQHSGVHQLGQKRDKLKSTRALPDIADEVPAAERYVVLEEHLLALPEHYEADWDWAVRFRFWFSKAFRELLERVEEQLLSTAELQSYLEGEGLVFPEELLANYVLALQTKGFVILTGISGTGKSQLALRTATKLAGYEEEASEDVVTAITVKPDWTDNRGLLGYHNPITGRYTRPTFLRNLLQTRGEELEATRQGRRAEPFFTLLDEMNLARVEHYFAEFLSGMESKEPIELHSRPEIEAGSEQEAVPQRIRVPENLFFTGTVNIDETTHMFSPKVLDRAFTIEFNTVDLEDYGSGDDAEVTPEPEGLRLDEIPVPLYRDSRPSRDDWDRFREIEGGRPARALVNLNSALEEYNLHFGYRVANEISRFVMLADRQLSDDSSEQRWAAFDIAVLQKILPKFNGTDELREPLLRMFSFCMNCEPGIGDLTARQVLDEWTVRQGRLRARSGPGSGDEGETPSGAADPRLARTGAKVRAMLRRLEAHGFTSFMD